MKIIDIQATALKVPVTLDFAGLQKKSGMGVCLVTLKTESGHTGYGMTGITNEAVVAAAINQVVAPALIGQDAMNHERIWERMYWLLSPRGQTGHASHAISAIDTALWDVKGKFLDMPIWKLLGGAREKVQTYTTFGFPFFDRDELVTAARYWSEKGNKRLKMVVGFQGLQNRDTVRSVDQIIIEDAARVRAVREAVGEDVELYIDANCSLDAPQAARLCDLIEDCNISFFEEPVTQNDVRKMADLRQRKKVAVAAGQNEGLIHRFRDLLLANAVDYVQPNVVISGGITQCVRIAGLAQAFNVPILNGGAWPFHNMHLHGGLSNGTMVECHQLSIEVYKKIFDHLPEPESGWLTLPQRPGFGFDPNLDAIQELSRKA